LVFRYVMRKEVLVSHSSAGIKTTVEQLKTWTKIQCHVVKTLHSIQYIIYECKMLVSAALCTVQTPFGLPKWSQGEA